MPLKRRHVRIPAAIALVAVAAFAILWAGARTPYARGLIEGALTEAVGLPATVGRLRVGFFPSPRLAIGELTIGDLLEVERIEVTLPWRSLFGATDRIDALTVSQATARLRIGADGASNWSRLFAGQAESAPPPAEPSRWSLGKITLEGGAIDFRDAATGTAWQLTGVTAQAREVAPGVAFPLELQAAGIAGGNTFHFASQGEVRLDLAAGRYEASTIAYRGWLGGDPLPLAGAELTGTLAQAIYESSAGMASFAGGRFEFAEIPGRFEGTLALGAPAMAAEVRVATEAFAPRAPAIILGLSLIHI